jgi:hypothetical protein
MAAELVKGVIDYSANVIFGACIDENMSDEVEVVIIATGFPAAGQTITGVEDRAASMRKASVLSDRIDQAYTMGGAPQQTYAQQGYGYAQPAEPVPQQPQAFEPDDPIPDEAAATQEPAPEKKRRPKFVDFFIKRNENK